MASKVIKVPTRQQVILLLAVFKARQLAILECYRNVVKLNIPANNINKSEWPKGENKKGRPTEQNQDKTKRESVVTLPFINRLSTLEVKGQITERRRYILVANIRLRKHGTAKPMP